MEKIEELNVNDMHYRWEPDGPFLNQVPDLHAGNIELLVDKVNELVVAFNVFIERQRE